MYSKDDVEEILAELTASVRDRVKRDLETTAGMAALVLDQAITSAEDQGASLALEMGRTEDVGACTGAPCRGRGHMAAAARR